ncbi:MAG: histidine--tRNA ligase [Candidatus Bostrichicola ureolyticus]|nr:MAG: histidine--tRNA ligase [Candidatus Bostrichicola ureolyticus]
MYTLPRGMHDFSSEKINQRNYIIDIIRKNFEYFGFDPLETPAIENISTLTKKYGEEGEKLIFKIINSGDFIKGNKSLFQENNYKNILSAISNKGLRYDLTVPFVRYVVMNKHDIIFPFKRYQIQPVWRADKPQKGRFREFYQCDADIIGSKYLWQEIELIQLYDEIFTKLNIPILIIINHKEIITGLLEICNIDNNYWNNIFIALDKWYKIGLEGVKKELLDKGIPHNIIKYIEPFFLFKGTFKEKIEFFYKKLTFSNIGTNGIKDIKFIYNTIQQIGLNASLEFNLNLVRGLNYYTGIVFEVMPKNKDFLSIGGGGRYDKLTHIFGLNTNISGVGISLGLDRICILMQELKLFKNIIKYYTKILFINFGNSEAIYAYKLIKILRSKNISSELYPKPIKIKKQLEYANKKRIPFIISIGKKEIERNKILIKNMILGTENEYDNIETLISNIN